ncbi:NADPH-dependent FMN reductase [Aminomonas paucivorans DSM 12260]|uniref:NADPH-dependent FMN reductase n=1 Tax=Aminomonas paucivorans DSM 12260 TaxID=584708 RepID=E3CWF4_9BACT|nr:flavodoxin family protein [Aminomonas paucivorans]EFQ24309.1 NADPH-dependent FMN reductase [Aminomonas paucivorans DSM 12260]
MKVLGINGSPREGGNTEILMRTVFGELEAAGVETELVRIGGRPFRGCVACRRCFENRDRRCVLEGDPLNELVAKMAEADGILLGSPVYYTDVTSEMKGFLDRAGLVSGANGGLFRHKAGAAVLAVRRGGATHAFDTLNHWLHMMQTYLVGASYWNMGYGMKPGDVAEDQEGMENMRVLGRNMAWLLERIVPRG